MKEKTDISWSKSTSLPLSIKKLKACLQCFLKTLGFADRTIELYVTDDHEIRELNRHYRDQNAPTDVLAWSYWENDPGSEMLGEIVISMDRVKEQALSHGWSDEAELLRLLAHGCAHLVGYDHERSPEEEKRMLAVEIEMLRNVGLDSIYSHTDVNQE